MRQWVNRAAVAAGAAVVLTLSAAAVAPPAAGASRDRVKLHAAFPAALPVLGDQAMAFARRATAGSGGALSVRHFEPGPLLPRCAYLDAVVQGAVDSAWGTPAVAGGPERPRGSQPTRHCWRASSRGCGSRVARGRRCHSGHARLR